MVLILQLCFDQWSDGQKQFWKLSIWNRKLMFCVLVQDVNLSMERLTSNKGFTNKLWNAGKFILLNLPPSSDSSAWERIREHKVDRYVGHPIPAIVLNNPVFSYLT